MFLFFFNFMLYNICIHCYKYDIFRSVTYEVVIYIKKILSQTREAMVLSYSFKSLAIAILKPSSNM